MPHQLPYFVMTRKGVQINPAQTAATATTAEIPFRNILPPPTTTPALVDCVGVLLVSLPVFVAVLEGEEAEEAGEVGAELELEETKTPPATLAGVVLFVVFEAARA
jgi:hypothetical protein